MLKLEGPFAGSFSKQILLLFLLLKIPQELRAFSYYWIKTKQSTKVNGKEKNSQPTNKNFLLALVRVTLGARGLHAPHPDSLLKAGKMSAQYEAIEVSEVLVTCDLWFQLSKISFSC